MKTSKRSYGPASACRRISPTTGEVVAVIPAHQHRTRPPQLKTSGGSMRTEKSGGGFDWEGVALREKMRRRERQWHLKPARVVPTDKAFWRAWGIDKEALKAAGFKPCKVGGRWLVVVKQ